MVIECDAADEEAVFLCQYGGSGGEVNVEWIINSTPYTQRLPLGHYYKDKKRRILSVTNIKSWQNGTTYQCNLLSPTGSGETCVYSSTIGILIVKCQGNWQVKMHQLYILLLINCYDEGFSLNTQNNLIYMLCY